MNDREKTVYVINRKYGRHFVKIAILTVFVLALCAGLFLAGIYVTAEDIRSDAAKARRRSRVCQGCGSCKCAENVDGEQGDK